MTYRSEAEKYYDVMESEELKKSVIADVVLLKLVGFKPIIVHGGGKEISKWVGKAGIQPEFYDGLRITDADTLEVAEMVLGKVNKELVTLVGQLGVKAIGISGKDGRMLTVKKKMPDGKDIGYVGEIEHEFVYYSEKKTDTLSIIERGKDADIIIDDNTPLTAGEINGFEKARYIAVAFTGVDHAPYRMTGQNIMA